MMWFILVLFKLALALRYCGCLSVAVMPSVQFCLKSFCVLNFVLRFT